MKELEIIQAIRSRLKTCREQKNILHSSDAEIIELGENIFAFSIDEFSSEDHFSISNPKLLGWNLTTATMSDLLAVGSQPKFLMHSLVATKTMTPKFLQDLAEGIQESLDAFQSYFIGGDTGTGSEWRYTGVAIGTIPDKKKLLSRHIPLNEGIICVTGTLGDANLEVFLNSGDVKFECRVKEARLLKQYRAACIDTSDGFVNALETVHNLNKKTEFIIDLDSIPYANRILKTSEDQNIPREAFLFGSSGEYELLFFAPHSFEKELRGKNFKKVGYFSCKTDGSIFYQKRSKKALIKHKSLLIDPREIKDIDTYIKEIIGLTKKLFT